jgi:hypothetical protein
MAIGIDWKRSIILSVILIATIYILDYFITDEGTFCIAAIIAVVVIFALGNLAFRGR